MGDFPDLVDPDTLVVFNNSKVRKARLYGWSEQGGRVEFFLLKPRGKGCWLCLVNKAKKQGPGKVYTFPAGVRGEILRQEGPNHRLLAFHGPLGLEVDDDYLDLYGHVPLPPYIKREDSPEDAERYQSVFCEEIGSVAAPTASLHFTQSLLDRLTARGVQTAFVTLHVGLGTFAPVRSENLLDHKMHAEDYHISEDCAQKVEAAYREKRTILAVGTTVVRTLEAAWQGDHLALGVGSTDIFIYPGYEFKLIRQIFTNFHTPESTLLVLISAFAGRELIQETYQEALQRGYQFFSYGDAMLIR